MAARSNQSLYQIYQARINIHVGPERFCSITDLNEHVYPVVYMMIYSLQVTLANWYTADGRQKFEQFSRDVIERTAEPPWNNDYAKVNNIPVRMQRLLITVVS